MKNVRILLIGIIAACVLSGIVIAAESIAGITVATARIFPTAGNTVTGLVSFTLENGAMHIKGSFAGLSPGKHGIHIHEFGDLSKEDGTSAGGHFNPALKTHASHENPERHAGDLGNIEADQKGNATLDISDSILAFSGDRNIIGRAVIIHEKEDDFKTQPTGNSGSRIGYGVIGIGSVKK